MDVCMLAYTFYEADNRVRRYAEALVKRGDRVDAIALLQEGQPLFEIIRGVRVHRIQKRRIDERGPLSYLWKLLLFFLRSFWFLTIHNRYDIIHVHSVPDFEVFATIVPKYLGARIILDIHDVVPEFYASKFNVGERSVIFRVLLLIERLSISYSDHVIISNHLWREKIVHRSSPAAKCTAIINYPDPSLFRRNQMETQHRDFVMCYPGTLNRHQGVDLAVRSMVTLRHDVPNLRLLVIGDGPDREKLTRMVAAERLEDRVSIQGFVPLETICQTMSTVDLGVVPKRRDSFGNEAFSTKILEFMAMGVPVVVSDTRIDKYYFNDDLVQFFESDNPEDLANKILDLVHDEARRNLLRANALLFIAKNNWEVKKQEYLSLVDQLMTKGSHAASHANVTTSASIE